MIRNATDEDKQALGEVYCYSWKAAYKGIIPDNYLDSLTVENCTPFKVNPFANLVIESSSKVVGLINFGAGRDQGKSSIGEIRAIYVLPEYWDKGFGAELFNAAVLRLKEMSFEKVFLWVLKDNFRARKFYERMNMTCTYEEKTITISGRDLSEVKYELSLI